MNRRARRATASQTKTAKTSQPAHNTPAAFYDIGLHHLYEGYTADAARYCRQALALDANHAHSLHMMGVISTLENNYNAALEWLNKAIEQEPKAEFLCNLGSVLHAMKRLDEALKAYERATTIEPDKASIWKNMGDVFAELKRYDEAERAFTHALELDPKYLDAALDSGNLFARLRHYDKAITRFELASEIEPSSARAYSMRKLCLIRLGRRDEVLTEVRKRATTLDPTSPEAHNDFSTVFQACGESEEALQYAEKALALRPDFPGALINKALALADLRRNDEAKAAYARAIAIEPDNADAHWNLSFLQLLQGDYEAGWKGREWRLKMPELQPILAEDDFKQPAWDGTESVTGKTVLVHGGEGLGDQIQYARYVPMLAARGAKVILQVDSPLYRLMEKMDGVTQCLPHTATDLPPFDLHCPTSSLPFAFDTRVDTIPATVPYLPAPDQARRAAWDARLGPHNRLRVGLVWSGNKNQTNDRNRSTTLRTLAPLLNLDATFVSLQKDPRPDDKAFLRGRSDIIDLTDQLTDFADTAALVSCLDLVISVCTSTAHLTGALGKPVWLMLCHAADWRWMLDREDSPWYPTARLFRQSNRGDWDGLVARVRGDLQALIAQRSAEKPHQPTVLLNNLMTNSERQVFLNPVSLPNIKPAPSSNNNAAALFARGLQHMNKGKLPEAEQCCREAITLDPKHADSLHMMGVIASLKQNYDAAIDWYAQAIRLEPKAEYLSNLGTALKSLNRLDEALKAYDKAAGLEPNNATVWKNIGNLLLQLKRSDEAEIAFNHALKLDPRHLETILASAQMLADQNRHDEAIVRFDLADEIKPGNVSVATMRLMCRVRAGRYDEVLAELDKLKHSLDLNNPAMLSELGVILLACGKGEEALRHFNEALARQPNFYDALVNMGFTLSELQRFDEAFEAYAKALSIKPESAQAHWNLALLQLLLGDFEAGWKGREWRRKMPEIQHVLAERSFDKPEWDGKASLSGKTILVQGTEGLGDQIQFSRYVPLLAERGAKIILHVIPSLCPLLAGMPGVVECLPKTATDLPPFDLHYPTSSFPLAFDTRLDTIPAQVPYLPAPSETRRAAWQTRLGPHRRLRVGLVWSGNKSHKNDINRSLPLHRLTPILSLDADFISLQKDPRDTDKPFLRSSNITDLTEHLADFADTAALVSCLDLVISVDTSTAHLTGALGKPVWILLPFTPDYRWLLEREDSPWYPTARLFRQNKPSDWDSVIANVRASLQGEIAKQTR